MAASWGYLVGSWLVWGRSWRDLRPSWETSWGPSCTKHSVGPVVPNILGAQLYRTSRDRSGIKHPGAQLYQHLGGPVVPNVSGARLYHMSWGRSCTKHFGGPVVPNISQTSWGGSCVPDISGARLYQTSRRPSCTKHVGGAVVLNVSAAQLYQTSRGPSCTALLYKLLLRRMILCPTLVLQYHPCYYPSAFQGRPREFNAMLGSKLAIVSQPIALLYEPSRPRRISLSQHRCIRRNIVASSRHCRVSQHATGY